MHDSRGDILLRGISSAMRRLSSHLADSRLSQVISGRLSNSLGNEIPGHEPFVLHNIIKSVKAL